MFSGWPSQSVQAQNFSRIHAAWPAGRVGQAIAQGLRPGRLLLGVTRVPVGVIFDSLERPRLFWGRLALHLRPRRHGERDVNAGAVAGILRAERGGHGGAPVAALRAIAGVAQAIHQLGPGGRDAIDAPAGGLGLVREAEAGQRRTDHVEGVGGIATVRGRVDQRFDDLVEFDNRAGPAVGEDQRQGLGMRRAHVQEMNIQPVDLGGELGETIEQRLPPAPIVVTGPVPADLLDPLQRHALAPVVDRFGLRPAGPAQSRFQVVQNVVVDGDTKGLCRAAHGVPLIDAEIVE